MGFVETRSLTTMQRCVTSLLGLVLLLAGNPTATAKDLAPSLIDEKARQFWSFQPVKAVTPPVVKNHQWLATPIDAFILAKVEAADLEPAPSADRRTLLRRATFDLIGLPPTPGEVRAFVEDESPNAFAKVIDRLLDSPRYGERFGRRWLDVVRYADTAGDGADFPIPEAHRYRDYVINAFNEDMPYDRFIREQIAGDLLARHGPEYVDADPVIATGYLAIARRIGFFPPYQVHLTYEDAIDTLGRSFLGLTLGCARCHDHKYDPITVADYYGLYGILSSSRFPSPGSERRPGPRYFVPLLPPSKAGQIKPFHAELARLDEEAFKLEEEKSAADDRVVALEHQLKNATTPQQLDADRARLEQASKQQARIVAAYDQAKKKRKQFVANRPRIDWAYAMAEGTPSDVPIQVAGDPKDLGKTVPRRFLEILGAWKLEPGETGSGRLQLARWLSTPKNPLTSRVMVNRVWQHHFGRGIVATLNDFGKRGIAPSHPELLDYLSARFMAEAWSIKSLHRLIMLSRTYQLSSQNVPSNLAIDPANKTWWRFERKRLDAETIRDSLLAVSGQIDCTMGGSHPFPPVKEWSQHNPFMAVYDTNRRSVYLMVQRNEQHPFLSLFDGADPTASTAVRSTTTVPAQALFMMNDPFVHEQCAGMGRRFIRNAQDDLNRINWAYQLVLSRPPDAAEINQATAFLERYRLKLGGATDQTIALRHQEKIWSAFARVLVSGNEFMFVD